MELFLARTVAAPKGCQQTGGESVERVERVERKAVRCLEMKRRKGVAGPGPLLPLAVFSRGWKRMSCDLLRATTAASGFQ